MQIAIDVPAETGTIESSDGTVLSYVCLGEGDPLVVCHGSLALAQDWMAFAVEMAATRRVILYDRRRRGLSADGPSEPAVEAEVDDLACVIDMAGPGAAVLGHSFGGGCALAFAARGTFDGPLILYEPRHSSRRPVSGGHIPELRRLLGEGDRRAALRFALIQIIGAPPAAVEGFEQSPLWGPMIETISALPDELRLLDSLMWQAGELDCVVGPATLLIGENSRVLPDDLSPDLALRVALPRLQTVVVPGQTHFAYAAVPALLAGIVRDCLGDMRADPN